MAVSAGMALASTAVGSVTGTYAFGATLASIGITGALSHFLVTTALGAALNALAPKPSVSTSGYNVTQAGTALDHQVIYGEVRCGGVIVYDNTTGSKNKFLHRVIAIAGHVVDSYTGIYVNGEEVSLTSGNTFTYTIEATYTIYPEEGPSYEDDFVFTISEVDLVDSLYSSGDTLSEAQLSSLISAGVTSFVVPGALVSATVSNIVSDSGFVAGGTYDGLIKVNLHKGSQTVADVDLVNAIDEWTQYHILKGVAYAYIRLEYDATAFSNGIPDITFKVKGKKVYDPRVKQTLWSDNPALCIRDYLINKDYGLGENTTEVNEDNVVTAATVCDSIKTNGEPRFTFNGNFTTGQPPIDILNDALTSMGGLLWYSQGQWKMKAASWVEPTVSFNEDDLRSSISVTTRHSRRDNYNTVIGKYRGEETSWQITDYPQVTDHSLTATVVTADSLSYGEWYSIKTLGDTDWNAVAGTSGVTYEVGDIIQCVSPISGAGSTGDTYLTENRYILEDGGQESVIDLSLPFTDNSEEAQDIARLSLKRNRKQITFSATFGMKAFKVEIGDNVYINIKRFGWVDKPFEVVDWAFGYVDGDLQTKMVLRETSEDIFI